MVQFMNMKDMNNNMEQSKFTYADALEIQKNQLWEWSLILKPKIHKLLVKWVNERNEENTAMTIWGVKRGVDMQNFIGTHMGQLAWNIRNKNHD